MQEKDVIPEVMRKLRSRVAESAACEVKLARGASLPYSAVKDHQLQALYHSKHRDLAFKIPDFGAQNPFDFFILTNALAFVAVVFYEPRKPKVVCFIDVDEWNQHAKFSSRKSILIEEAKSIAFFWEVL